MNNTFASRDIVAVKMFEKYVKLQGLVTMTKVKFSSEGVFISTYVLRAIFMAGL